MWTDSSVTSFEGLEAEGNGDKSTDLRTRQQGI